MPNIRGFHGGEKQKGNRRAWQTACSPNVEEMGERPGHGTELVPPIKKEKSTRQIVQN